MRRVMKAVFGLVALLMMTSSAAVEVQWPQFRGPAAGAIADDPALPDTWSETQNIMWKTAIPGLGWSSPIHPAARPLMSTVAERPGCSAG